MGEVVDFDDWYKRSGEVLDDNDGAMAEVYAFCGLKRVIRPTEFGGLRPDEVPKPEPPDIVA